MLPALAAASNALLREGRRAAEIAAAVASPGAGAAAPAGSGAPPVRIGALPLGPVESLVGLKEVETAYRLNAAVIRTADAMLEALFDALGPERR